MASRRQLKIFQWNCRSLRNKIGLLQDSIHEYDILILCETWLTDTSIPKINDFNIIYKNRNANKRGGLAICLKKDIPFTLANPIYHVDNSIESLAVSISTQLGSLLIVALYISPSTTMNVASWPI